MIESCKNKLYKKTLQARFKAVCRAFYFNSCSRLSFNFSYSNTLFILTLNFQITLYLIIFSTFLFGFNTNTIYSQEQNQATTFIYPNERIIPCKQGFIGLYSQAESSQLRLYGKYFKQISSVQFQKLYPQDFSESYILSAQSGSSQLFKIEYSPELRITPIKHKEIFECNKILQSTSESVILSGLQGIVALNSIGEEKWKFNLSNDSLMYSQQQSSIADVICSAETVQNNNSIFALVKTNSNILLKKINSETGIQEAEAELTYAENCNICGMTNGKIYIFANSPNTAYLLDSKSMVIESSIKINQNFISNFLINSQSNSHELSPAFLTSTYPTPYIYTLEDNKFENLGFDYPLQSTVLSGFYANNYLVLASSDSAVIFNEKLDMLLKERISFSQDVKIFEIDSTLKIISTAKGSLIFSNKLEKAEKLIDYLKKYKTLFYILISCFLFTPIWLIYRYYKHIGSVYDNIVKVPESGGVIVISKSQKLVRLNNAARNYLLLPQDIPTKKHIFSYIPNEYFNDLIDSLKKLFTEGTPFETKIFLYNGEESKQNTAQTLVFRGRVMVSSLGFSQGYIILIEDITKTIEQERLVNWASVAHHIAHGMKTPLSAIRLSAESLMNNFTNKDNNDYTTDNMRAATRIASQSEKLRSIVMDLMSVAKTESINLAEVDLKLVLATLVHEYEELIPANINLNYAVQENDIRHKIDTEQFSVAIKNIIDNSIQAIGERANGEISITLTKNDKVNLIIQDNGGGMSEQTLRNIFQPFYTEKIGGNGIGMVIVKRVIEGHNGEIKIESKQGVGSKFIIYL